MLFCVLLFQGIPNKETFPVVKLIWFWICFISSICFYRMPIFRYLVTVAWHPVIDSRLSVLQSLHNLCLSLTDQLLFRPDNTFHYRLLDIGNKFGRIGNKTANKKKKKKRRTKGFKFIAAIIRSEGCYFLKCLWYVCVF